MLGSAARFSEHRGFSIQPSCCLIGTWVVHLLRITRASAPWHFTSALVTDTEFISNSSPPQTMLK